MPTSLFSRPKRRAAPSPRKGARGFATDQRGSTAIEFAAVAAPFIYMIMGGIEIALVNLTYSSVQNGMHTAMRVIQTGEGGCMDVDAVKTEICASVKTATSGLCGDSLRISLEELDAFTAARADTSGSFTDLADAVAMGESNSVMMLQVVYQWDAMTPLLDKISGGRDGYMYLRNSIAFKNEPFGDLAGCVAGGGGDAV